MPEVDLGAIWGGVVTDWGARMRICAAQMRDLTDDVPHALRAKRLFQPRGACSHIRGRAEIRRNYRLVARRDQAVRRHRMYSTADGKATT
jgi:hypothetical protein